MLCVCAGPGPASNLDGENIAFGKVLQGYDTIRAMTAVPTFKSSVPDLYQKVAILLKDERAAKVRAKWGKPLKALVITGAGMA